jgi:hypothetical protein
MMEKAPRRRQVGIRKTIAVGAVVIESDGIETGLSFWLRDESGGCPEYQNEDTET